MLTEKMVEKLNKQVNQEFYSAYFYLAMSAHSEFLGFKGCASWFMMKNHEETQHAMKIYKYILDQGNQINLLPVEQPLTTCDSILAMFENTLTHEQEVTKNFNELMDIAMSEKDHATQIFLQWFITEQIEEEAMVSEVIAKFKMVGEKGDALFILDNQLGQLAKTQAVAGGTN